MEPDATTTSNVSKYWSSAWKTYGTVDGKFYAAPMLANVKGFIWYSPGEVQGVGCEVPKTYDELLDPDQDHPAKTGAAPWCAGFASDDASGWPGTDWIEDLVLRQSGPEVYDQWVAGKVKFTDPQIKDAFDAVGKILLDPAYVNAGFGDVKSINSTAFADVADKVADGTCPMTHQASFLSSNFLTAKTKDGKTPTIAPDGDVYAFLLPGIKEGASSVEVGGEFVDGVLRQSKAVQMVQEFMSSPDFANARVKLGGVISANNGADPSLASSQFLSGRDEDAAGQEHGRPVRRVRPDAGHRRVRDRSGRAWSTGSTGRPPTRCSPRSRPVTRTRHPRVRGSEDGVARMSGRLRPRPA